MRARGAAWIAAMIVSTLAATLLIIAAAMIVVATEHRSRNATSGDPASGAQARRDAVVAAAADGTVALNTVDYRTVDADLDRAESVQTDPLLTEYRRIRPQYRQSLVTGRAVVACQVAAAGIDRDDPASPVVLVAINVQSSGGTTAPARKQQLFTTTVTSVGGRWLVRAAAPVNPS